ncbi:astacin [Teladorsagia circumcincta]|uniref:Metalloendopeptidase n=1 Tax=Teladorsagia circumcincta TaxID=45464 RepID=A0A2G9U3D5_TELCI|nr:astacin [Teladorsagia circumcincta]
MGPEPIWGMGIDLLRVDCALMASWQPADDIEWQANVKSVRCPITPSTLTTEIQNLGKQKLEHCDDTKLFPLQYHVPFVLGRSDLMAGGVATKRKLTDLLQPNANRRIFDTLSAIVANEYESRPTSFDASRVIQYDEPSFSIKKLNEKYSSLLYESDMVLHPDRLEEIVANSQTTRRRLTKRKAFVDYMYPRTIWTSGVPYSIHSSIAGRARENVIRAINFWQSETCINFRPRTNERHFVEFIGNDDGCWSTVGKDEAIGRQFGVTSHELAHSLGVFHEQSRYDRDATVQLNRNVVDPTLLFNFAKIGPKELNTYRLPYDVGSVMHYTPTESSCGLNKGLTIDKN